MFCVPLLLHACQIHMLLPFIKKIRLVCLTFACEPIFLSFLRLPLFYIIFILCFLLQIQRSKQTEEWNEYHHHHLHRISSSFSSLFLLNCYASCALCTNTTFMWLTLHFYFSIFVYFQLFICIVVLHVIIYIYKQSIMYINTLYSHVYMAVRCMVVGWVWLRQCGCEMVGFTHSNSTFLLRFYFLYLFLLSTSFLISLNVKQYAPTTTTAGVVEAAENIRNRIPVI